MPITKIESLYRLHNGDGQSEYKDVKLDEFVMHALHSNVAEVTVRPPEKGTYYLSMYARDSSKSGKEGLYANICQYTIYMVQDPSKEAQAFPPCARQSYGPGDSFHKYQLKPTNSSHGKM